MTHQYKILQRSVVGRLLTCVALTAVMAVMTRPTWAEPFEMMVHDDDVYGADKVESGDFDEAIRRLNKRLGGEGQSNSKRTPVLIDLCVAHTMVGDYETATQRCNEAVETGWYSGLARNNRAVLWITMGRYDEAVQEFEQAVESRGASALARRNLQRAQARLAAIQEQQRETRLAAASSQPEVSDR